MKRIMNIASAIALVAALGIHSLAQAAVGATEAELKKAAKQAEETKKAINKHYTVEGRQQPNSDGMEDGRDVAAAAKKVIDDNPIIGENLNVTASEEDNLDSQIESMVKELAELTKIIDPKNAPDEEQMQETIDLLQSLPAEAKNMAVGIFKEQLEVARAKATKAK